MCKTKWFYSYNTVLKLVFYLFVRDVGITSPLCLSVCLSVCLSIYLVNTTPQNRWTYTDNAVHICSIYPENVHEGRKSRSKNYQGRQLFLVGRGVFFVIWLTDLVYTGNTKQGKFHSFYCLDKWNWMYVCHNVG